jgi:hypothetical protein
VTDGYEGYADYQAPYPLNAVRELNPVILPRVLGEVFRIDSDDPPQGFDASKYPKNLGLIAMARAMVNGSVIQGSLVEPVYALIRRLNLVGIGRSIRRPIQWYGG